MADDSATTAPRAVTTICTTLLIGAGLYLLVVGHPWIGLLALLCAAGLE